MRTIFISLIMVLCSVAAGAGNRLSSGGVTLSAPEGFIFNQQVSKTVGMDVFMSGDKAISISTGTLPTGASPQMILRQLAKPFGLESHEVKMTQAGVNSVMYSTSADGCTTVAVMPYGNGNDFVALIIVGVPGDATLNMLHSIVKR